MNKKNQTNKSIHRHWIRLLLRAIQFTFFEEIPTSKLVTQSYNQISPRYDTTWTTHMRDKSIELINNLQLDNVENALDLSCGTGFITNMLSTYTKDKSIGVDQSEGMLSVAKQQYKESCSFYHSDIVEYLKNQPSNQFDIITNGWGLGYSKPFQIIKNSFRVLKPGGQFAVIDNTLFSIKEAIWTVIVTAAEDPTMFQSMFKIRFLATLGALKRRMNLSGFHISKSWKGSKTYYVKNGRDALKRLHNTGAFAGLENCVYPHRKKEFDTRFIANLERMYLTNKGIPITHRYIAAIGTKKN